MELVLGQALVLVWMGINFSLAGGAKGTSSHRIRSLFHLFSTVGKRFGVTLQPFEYSETLLNGHPSTVDTHNIMDNSKVPTVLSFT